MKEMRMKKNGAKILDTAFLCFLIAVWYFLSLVITRGFEKLYGRQIDTSSAELMIVIIPGVVIWAYIRHIYLNWVKTWIGLRNFGFLKPKDPKQTQSQDHMEPN